MFDANKVLGVLMESGMSRSGQSRVQRLAGSGGQGGGGLASLAGALLGGGGAGLGGSGGLAGIAGSLLGGGGSRGGGGLGSIAGALLGDSTGRSSAMPGGAMGILGTLAGVAMQHFGSAQDPAQPGLAEDAEPYAGDEPTEDENARAMVMIQAMITAAKADGEIDPQERQRILGRLEEAGADPDAQAFVRAEMNEPADVDAIVGMVGSPHAAIEAYTASLFAIDVDTPAEADYMRRLAQGLGLDPTLVRTLHETLEAPAPN